MARIRRIEYRADVGIDRFRSETDAAWGQGSVDGEPVLCLRTYGSEARQDTGSVSQALDLDEEAARALLSAIREVFPGLP